VQNRLLAALPKPDRDRLVPTLDVIPLTLKALLHKPGEHVEYVYFPGGGFCSIVTVLKDGGMVEVATVGREGVLGVPAALDGHPVSSATMVQGAADTCYRMTTAAFRREMDRRGAFSALLTHFAKALMGFVMQSTACNAVHSVEQRLARWLLMAQDRMGTTEFPLTQEFAAMMLGASRPTVTVVAGTLQKAGLITYHRGQVTILDREKLESASCECYRAATNLLLAVTATRPAASA
jgi:CRP-like cAMP-binding protein